MNTPTVRESSNVPANPITQAPQVLKGDIIVPYICLGQGLSKAVTDQEVDLGDIYRSTSREVLGSTAKPLDVIFLHYPKADWVYEQKGKSKFEYRWTEPRTASNETLPWSFFADDEGNDLDPKTKGATEWRRTKRLLVFGILPADITAALKEMEKAAKGELPDPSKALTPVAFSFRSSGYNTGKEICTFFTQAQSMKVPVWRYQLPLFDVKETNDDGTFFVWKTDRTKAKGVAPEHLPLVSEWAQLINQGAPIVVVDEDGAVEGERDV